MDDLAVVPAWVAPAHQQVVELNYMANELATAVGAPHGAGQLAAVGWVTGQCAAPVTRRPERATWELTRAESWVALCSAAHDCSPTAGDWERLAVAPSRRWWSRTWTTTRTARGEPWRGCWE